MEVGRIIGGKYRLRREIGEGAMGSVWAAEHEVLGRPVAIKFMRPLLEDAETSAARFVAEAKAAAQVKHRFVVDVFDFGIEADGSSYMVQELLDGQSLAEVMQDDVAWPVNEIVQFAAKCLSGLQAVHDSGVVHRDLKPENIFVIYDADGRFPKLLDFGISKAGDASAEDRVPSHAGSPRGRARQLTAVGRTLGTPAYMSPEQLRNSRDLDARADLYSMGVVLYEWLTGRCPYQGTNNYAELYHQIFQRSMAPITTLRPDLKPALCQVIERALSPERDQRFASATAMRDALLASVQLSSMPRRSLSSSLRGEETKPAARPGRLDDGTLELLESAKSPFRDASEPPPPRPVRGLALAIGGVALLAAVLSLSWPKHEVIKPAAVAAMPRTKPLKAEVRAAVAASAESAAPSAAVVPSAPAQAAPPTDLPWGADIPEDLPAQPAVPANAEDSSPESNPRSARRQRHRAASEPASESATWTPAAQLVPAAPPPEVLPSSSEPARPNKPKVVRQLDF